MTTQQQQKPSFEEWLYWAKVVVDRLIGCTHVYKRNLDVFMAEVERQTKTDKAIKLLQRIYPLLDRAETEESNVPDLERDEKIISEISELFAETLKALPWLSTDMQKLLKSPWMCSFPNQIAELLFSGKDNEFQGIGSGYPEQGRLPAALADLIERENEGEVRPLREGLPQRHDVESHARWIQQNSSFLRTAGRVE